MPMTSVLVEQALGVAGCDRSQPSKFPSPLGEIGLKLASVSPDVTIATVSIPVRGNRAETYVVTL